MTPRNGLMLLGGLVIGLATSTWLSLHAQKHPWLPARSSTVRRLAAAGPQAETKKAPTDTRAEPAANDFQQAEQPAKSPPAVLSIGQALGRPYHFPFGKPTSLQDVCRQIQQTLGSPVVLDLAALDRLDLESTETVQLELDGVRLRTGLKLLLDQVGLTFRVVEDDNLLILTDEEGSEDPIERLQLEVRELHRDIHDVQDTLDELREKLGLDGAAEFELRQPTIIEEMPSEDAGKPAAEPNTPDQSRIPADRPQVESAPSSPPDSNHPASRVPLGRSRKKA
jgi:hypothetical protein